MTRTATLSIKAGIKGGKLQTSDATVLIKSHHADLVFDDAALLPKNRVLIHSVINGSKRSVVLRWLASADKSKPPVTEPITGIRAAAQSRLHLRQPLFVIAKRRSPGNNARPTGTLRMTDSDTPTQTPADTLKPMRRIRSFVLRMGRMTEGQQRALEQLWPRFGVDYRPEKIDPIALFGREAPRIVEIGFGTGEALFAYAQQHPETDCLGIEVHRPGAGHLFLQVESAGLTNVRASCHDAVEVLSNQIAAASIDAVHIFFPDPWHKTRHHKRRLIQPEFADLLAHVLKPGGMLRLATDWQHYAEHMRAVLDVHAQFINTADATGFIPRPTDRPLTRFERRGHRLGHGVWDMAYRRR